MKEFKLPESLMDLITKEDVALIEAATGYADLFEQQGILKTAEEKRTAMQGFVSGATYQKMVHNIQNEKEMN